MDASDLETYQAQLNQVELSLTADPDNAELASLRSELKELIELTQTALSQTAAASSSKADHARQKAAAAALAADPLGTGIASSSSFSSFSSSASNAAGAAEQKWAAGDECLAKYSGDGKWYPARITVVVGASDKHVYNVMFKGYNTTEQVPAGDVKALPASYLAASAAAGGKRKREETDDDKERRKKRNEKKLEVRAAKAKEQTDKQASWQKWTKKADKKGIHIAGVAGTSIFKTPENPHGKVGVTGSGKGMTDYANRSKHVFVPGEET